MPTKCHTLIELAPCGEPFPCPHLSCDDGPNEYVTTDELLRRRAEQYARQHHHTISTDDDSGD